jgi:hypothetical protein
VDEEPELRPLPPPRGVEASLWATGIIRAMRTVMVTLLRSPGRAIACV